MKHWLFKSEPDAFSIEDLMAMKGRRDHWDGIRNYQARNFMRDEMKKGDLGFFYHSSCKVRRRRKCIICVLCTCSGADSITPIS